jgi:hypothetical protein
MRIDDIQKRFSDFREFVIDFEVDAGRQERKCLKQALDMRIVAFGWLQREPGGNPRILLCEFNSNLAKVAQFTFIVNPQVIPHPNRP